MGDEEQNEALMKVEGLVPVGELMTKDDGRRMLDISEQLLTHMAIDPREEYEIRKKISQMRVRLK